MSKKTPQMYARGKYELKKPWSANASKIYTCIAIRSFEDIYKQGEDVYQTYYAAYLAEGDSSSGSAFSFNLEVAESPNIITLRADDNELIYVPDTYISSYPDTTTVPYSQLIAGVDLGILPDEYSTDIIEAAILDLVLKQFGIVGMIDLIRTPTSSNPTPEEHEQLVALREGAIASNPSLETQLEQANTTLARQGDYIRQLESSVRTLQTK